MKMVLVVVVSAAIGIAVGYAVMTTYYNASPPSGAMMKK